MVQRILQNLIVLFIVLTALHAETSISLGQTSGRYLQTISYDGNGRHYVKQSVLAGRPAIFFELDSGDHPLVLDNDLVVFGLGAMAETRHHDYVTIDDNTSYFPFYATYYLKYGQLAYGLGINLNLMQLRYKNEATFLGQQLGKQFFVRYSLDDYQFLEAGIMQTCAQTNYDKADMSTFYDSTNYIFRYGFYLERN